MCLVFLYFLQRFLRLVSDGFWVFWINITKNKLFLKNDFKKRRKPIQQFFRENLSGFNNFLCQQIRKNGGWMPTFYH